MAKKFKWDWRTSNNEYYGSNFAGGSERASREEDLDVLQDSWTPPENLSLTVLSSSSIKLDWDGGLDTIIQRSVDEINWTNICTVAAGTETYTDTGLTAETLYYYRVIEYFGKYTSPESNTDSDTTSA